MNVSESFTHRPVPAETSVCVMGLGYIGLPTASVLATKGFRVTGVDVRPEVVDTINRGEIHIEEPDLDILVRSAVNSGQLVAAESPQAADVFMICVPTPIRDDRTPDLTYIREACQAIQPNVVKGNLVILESTSPPRTTEEIVAATAFSPEFEIGKDVFVAHCPERVLPGRILLEVVQNDRVVGGMTPECAQRAKQFYESYVSGEVFATSALVAEVTKLAENSYRDVNIAFANELSMLAEDLNIDPWDVIELANRHPRVQILSPGPGVGGHCISVDPWFLVHAQPERTQLIRTAREVNLYKPQFVVRHVMELAKQFETPKLGCLGLAYKADVDDIRESPALDIVRGLVREGVGDVMVCDPYVRPEQFDELPLSSLTDVLEACPLILLLTDHRQFRDIPRRVLQEKVVVDTRGLYR
ncbi:MAG: UDP-N-acetyl-D-mannosamine dehydrogenase [Pirellulaceae bacterium]|nr:UDP-N-acetyl-D-mannosamine dehydrogenase [Pirellulaceae bacterium]